MFNSHDNLVVVCTLEFESEFEDLGAKSVANTNIKYLHFLQACEFSPNWFGVPIEIFCKLVNGKVFDYSELHPHVSIDQRSKEL